MPVKKGDTVSIHYKIFLEDGTEFETTRGSKPPSFIVGENQAVPGIDRGVLGMRPGELKRLTLLPKDGYGERRKDLITRVNKSRLPADIKTDIGQRLGARRPDGMSMEFTITAHEGDMLVLDANHLLAGLTVEVELELIAID